MIDWKILDNDITQQNNKLLGSPLFFSCRLSQAAMAKFEEIKEQSATGLQYAIEQRKFTAINVDLKPSCVIVPHKGFYKS